MKPNARGCVYLILGLFLSTCSLFSLASENVVKTTYAVANNTLPIINVGNGGSGGDGGNGGNGGKGSNAHGGSGASGGHGGRDGNGNHSGNNNGTGNGNGNNNGGKGGRV